MVVSESIALKLYFLVLFVFGSQQLNSETIRLAGIVFHSQKNGSTILEGFAGSTLKTRLSNQVVTKKTHKNENPCEVCEVFQLKKQKVSKAF